MVYLSLFHIEYVALIIQIFVFKVEWSSGFSSICAGFVVQVVAEEKLAVVCLLWGVVRMPLDSGWTQGRAGSSGACGLCTWEWEVWLLLYQLGGLHQRSLRIHHGQKTADRLTRSECSSEAKGDFLFWNIFIEDQEPVMETCFCFVSLKERKEVE